MQQAAKDRRKATTRARTRNASCPTRKPSARRLTPEQAGLIRRNPPLIMNAAEAAAYTDTSERNFRELAEKGVFPHIRVGRRVLFRRDAIDTALAKLEAQNPAGDV